MDRRYFLAGAGCVLLGACAGSGGGQVYYSQGAGARATLLMPTTDEPFRVTPVNLSQIPAQYRRQVVRDPTGEAPGTIVVDPGQRYLYLVEANGRARRYGIGVGRQGFGWSGTAKVGAKREWPKWFPPVEMQERDERAREYADGMDGGPDNPLGARALYLYQDGKDTLYRIHGTAEPRSIGRAVSSGCIRMLNADVIDLYGRVPVGTKVVVMPVYSPIARLGRAVTGGTAQPTTVQQTSGSQGGIWTNIKRLLNQPPA